MNFKSRLNSRTQCPIYSNVISLKNVLFVSRMSNNKNKKLITCVICKTLEISEKRTKKISMIFKKKKSI